MFQIDGAGTVPALPAPQAVGTPGYFGRGDLGTGLRPTTVTADWANMITGELLTVIEAAGEAPSKTNFGQVLAAIQEIVGAAVAAAASVFSTDGSGNWKIVNANGVIEMGGVVSTPFTAETSTNLTFPFGGFPAVCFDFNADAINPSHSVTGATIIQESALTRLAVSIQIQDQSSTFSDDGGGFRWRAKGH